MIVRDTESGGAVRVNRTFTKEMKFEACELRDTPLLDQIHPDDRARFKEILDEGSGALTARHQTNAGDWLEFDWKVKLKGNRLSAFGVMHQADRSVTDRRTSAPAGAGSSMHQILHEMALIIEDERPGLKSSILLLDDEGKSVSVGAGPSLPDEYNKAVEGLLIGPEVGSCGTASYWNERVIVEDIQNDVLWKDLKEYAEKAGVAACWSHPVTSKSGQVLGATALYCTEARAPTQHELDGLATAARMFGLAIERSYAEQALKASEAERLRREAEIEDQLRHAAKMEAVGVLAGGIAHDFNNLLATIMGSAENAMESVADNSDALEMLRDITSASERASTLCSQMLAYAGRGTVTTERLDCNIVIRALGDLLKVTMPKKATLEFRLSADPLHVHADKAKLDQVIMNLITNAAEALDNQTGQIVARSGSRFFDTQALAEFQPSQNLTEAEFVWLSVADTGCGMTAETQAKIFDPFFTTKFTGRGLGMAAVSGILLQHQGGIRIETEPGKGTTITVVLPAAAPDANGPTPEGIDDSRRLPGSKRILVVDDDQPVRKAFIRGLTRAGFEVSEAANGREAINLHRQKPDAIDCVLLDLSMPDMDGEETFRELLQIRPDVRVVLNSGYAEEEILERFTGVQPAGILQKPCSRKDMITKIQDVLSPSAQ
jgi:signal transduction histidine kinase